MLDLPDDRRERDYRHAQYSLIIFLLTGGSAQAKAPVVGPDCRHHMKLYAWFRATLANLSTKSFPSTPMWDSMLMLVMSNP